MAQIFNAIGSNTSIKNLSLCNMNIPRESVVAMAQMFKNNPKINMLTLQNTGLSDLSFMNLADGLQSARNLIYLDLR